MELAQYRALATFAQFGASDLDAATRQQLDRGQRLTELLKQPQYQPRPLAEQVCSMYAAVNGFMDDIEVDRVAEFEDQLLGYLRTSKPEIFDSIIQSKDITEENDEALKERISAFKKSFS